MNEISIAAERQVVVDNIISGIMSLMFLYYVCNFEYRYCKKFIMFLQHKTNFSTFTALAHVVKLEFSICTAVSNYTKIDVDNLS